MIKTFDLPATTSPAAAGNSAVEFAAGLHDYDAISIDANLVGATGGTLDVYVQRSSDNGTTWRDYIHFPQLAAGAAAVKYTVAPSLGAGSIVVVGAGTTPALAVNTCTNGPWGRSLRVLMVAGSGTSAGAAVAMTLNCWSRKV
jgi:hypothetical protein